MSTRRAISHRPSCLGARRLSTFTLRLSRITTRQERLVLCASVPPPCRIRAISAPTSTGPGSHALGASCLRIRAQATVVPCTRSWPRPPHLTSRSRRTAFGSRLNSNVSHRKSEPAVCLVLSPPQAPRPFAPQFKHRTQSSCRSRRLQSMKVAGASRRSAAPGRQFIGVAEYGGVLGTFVAPCSPPLNSVNFCSRLTFVMQRLAATRAQAQRECAATLQRARPEAGNAVCAGGFAVAACGILWLSSPISPCAVSQATPMHPLLRRQALPVVQETAANHSIEPTATGVPASAAHVKR